MLTWLNFDANLSISFLDVVFYAFNKDKIKLSMHKNAPKDRRTFNETVI